MSQSRVYRFGPVERHGFLGSVRPGQAVVVLSGMLVALLTLGSSPSPGRAAGAIILVALSLVCATIAVSGRTVEQWLPVVGAWLIRRVRGRHRFRSRTPTAGMRGPVGGPAAPTTADVSLPPSLRGVRIVALPYGDRTVGAVSERDGRFLTALLSCKVGSFSLLDAAAQERCLSHWGNVLSAAADTPVRRIQWLERTTPAEPEALARWLESEGDPDLLESSAAITDSYRELIGRAARVSQEHQALVAIQIDAARVRGRGPGATESALIEEAERIAEGLRRAGVQIGGALTARHIASSFRTAFDPYVRCDLVHRGEAAQTSTASDAYTAWPVGAIEAWDHYRTDDAVHATYWIAGWPQIEVGALFLDPVLAQAAAVRTVGVTFEPLSAQRSIQEVEAQVTRDQADRALKSRFGQAEMARHEQVYAATRRREAELAAGYAEVRFAGFITVSAPDLDALHSSCAEVARDASRSRLELHPMYGQQAEAFTFTLPLCRGLR